MTTTVSRNTRSRIVRPRVTRASAPSASAVSVDTATPQPAAPSPPALIARYSAPAVTMPPSPATTGIAIRVRSRSSPRSSSRLASRPTTRKNSVISPSLTQPRRSVASSCPPRTIASRVSQTET